jgi:hypothetical protein
VVNHCAQVGQQRGGLRDVQQLHRWGRRRLLAQLGLQRGELALVGGFADVALDPGRGETVELRLDGCAIDGRRRRRWLLLGQQLAQPFGLGCCGQAETANQVQQLHINQAGRLEPCITVAAAGAGAAIVDLARSGVAVRAAP